MTKRNHTTPAANLAGPTLLMLRLSQCKTHPHNMRRVYPVKEVRQMAESIRARGGLIHALLVIDNLDGSYTVVDGNKRLAGGRLLGDECPPLKSEVVAQSRVEQYLTMAAANTVRGDVDPISEALHYKRLLDEGLTRLEIAERSGTYYQRIINRLALLALDPELQQLMAEDKLPHDIRVVNALLSIPDGPARVKLGRRLAEQAPNIKAVVAACELLAQRLADPNSNINRERRRGRPPSRPRAPEPMGMAPALALAQDKTGFGIPDNQRPGFPALRSAARQMCAACDIKTESLRERFDEPAWTLITHAAEETCGGCSVREVAGACNGCPGVELLSRLLRGANAKLTKAGEQIPERGRV